MCIWRCGIITDLFILYACFYVAIQVHSSYCTIFWAQIWDISTLVLLFYTVINWILVLYLCVQYKFMYSHGFWGDMEYTFVIFEAGYYTTRGCRLTSWKISIFSRSDLVWQWYIEYIPLSVPLIWELSGLLRFLFMLITLHLFSFSTGSKCQDLMIQPSHGLLEDTATPHVS